MAGPRENAPVKENTFMNLQIRPMERTDISALHSLLSDEAVMRYIEPPL